MQRHDKGMTKCQLYSAPGNKGIGSRYSYYMANDCMNPGGMTEKWSDCFSSKMEDRHIYAAYSIKYFGRDVISIDFNGKIEIIESFDFWPLPIPE
jgi:hypothetical protein